MSTRSVQTPTTPKSVFQVRDSKNTLGSCTRVRAKDSSQLALSFYHVALGTELRLLGLITSTFTLSHLDSPHKLFNDLNSDGEHEWEP